MSDAQRHRNGDGRLRRLLTSTIGAKIVMAVTGVVLVGFLVVHMLGNLQVYLGPDAFNHYAQSLKAMMPLVWLVRLTLLGALVLHVAAAVRLKRLNTLARPQAYAAPRRWRVTTPAARWMLFSGVVVLAFIVYHILHFTVGAVHAEHFGFHEVLDVATQTWHREANAEIAEKLPAHLVRHDVYSMFVRSFLHPAVAGAYVVAQLLLGLHLSHAVASMLHTLGLSKGAAARARNEWLGRGVAALIVIPNVFFPIAVQAGIVHL
jgi:succinate dehydrogenase / fumarate reductase cytochrome b subunit